jgi:alkylhydroperoxidase family enzyme
MAWIRTISPDSATGALKRQYETAVKRAGKVFQIIEIQSLRPRLLRASTQLYLEAMFCSDSKLSRAQREMIATTVSQVNGCFY